MDEFSSSYLNATFRYLGAGLSLTAAMAVGLHRVGVSQRLMMANPWIVLGGGLVASIGGMIGAQTLEPGSPGKYASWILFNAAQAAVLSPLLFVNPAILARAGLYTAGIMGSWVLRVKVRVWFSSSDLGFLPCILQSLLRRCHCQRWTVPLPRRPSSLRNYGRCSVLNRSNDFTKNCLPSPSRHGIFESIWWIGCLQCFHPLRHQQNSSTCKARSGWSYEIRSIKRKHRTGIGLHQHLYSSSYHSRNEGPEETLSRFNSLPPPLLLFILPPFTAFSCLLPLLLLSTSSSIPQASLSIVSRLLISFVFSFQINCNTSLWNATPLFFWHARSTNEISSYKYMTNLPASTDD